MSYGRSFDAVRRRTFPADQRARTDNCQCAPLGFRRYWPLTLVTRACARIAAYSYGPHDERGLSEPSGQVLVGGCETGGAVEHLAQYGQIAYHQRNSRGGCLHRGEFYALLGGGERESASQTCTVAFERGCDAGTVSAPRLLSRPR